MEAEKTSEVAAEGTRLHALAECIFKGEATYEELEHPADRMVWRRCKELMELPRFKVLSLEASYAVQTVEWLGARPVAMDPATHTYAPTLPGEVPCTVDLIYQYQPTGADRPIVVANDWKFGPGGLQHYTANTSAQLALAAVVASSLAPTECEVKGTFTALDGTVSAADWGDFVEVIASLVKTLQNVAPNPGDHCTFCKFKPECPPGQAALVAPVAEIVGASTFSLSYKIKSSAHASWTYMALGRIKREVKAIEDKLREYATEHAVIDKDGKRYEYREFDGKAYSIQAARFSEAELEQFVKEGKAKVNEDRGRWGWYATWDKKKGL